MSSAKRESRDTDMYAVSRGGNTSRDNGNIEADRNLRGTALHHRDYTVGWICTLEDEFAAAIALFDDEHPELPPVAGDPNAYGLGRMGQHNVVVGCSGHTTSAARVSQHMIRSFPSIHISLSVGLAGGAPSANADIRLGDVVVSQPTNQFGGVVQYDAGKALRDGGFVRTRALDVPPRILVSAVQRLRFIHETEGHDGLSKQLSTIQNRLSKAAPTFSRPLQETDRLFEADYVHVRSENTCDKCDLSKLVNRAPRDDHVPVVHYGLIASGQRVVKDAHFRDKWASKEEILCFEMEAAGLTNSFPCLVIRGICDYADSHQTRSWQQYAAATSAAYAKQVLSQIPGISAFLRHGIVQEDKLADISEKFSRPPGSAWPYGRLPGESWTRLVRLLGGQSNDSLNVEISWMDLDNPQEYEALSYVVGVYDRSSSLNMRLTNGNIESVSISRQLESALKALRLQSKDRWLWIDAISINQADDAEKMQQISLLGRIYQAAMSVCIWMGQSDAYVENAFAFCERLLDFGSLDNIVEDPERAVDWAALAEVTQRPWFTRRWIVQEIALARRAEIYCGTQNLPWDTFTHAVSLLQTNWEPISVRLSERERYRFGDTHAPGAFVLISLTNQLFRKNSNGIVTRRIFGLEQLLSMLPMFECSEPRDVIYSIMQIGNDMDSNDIMADYTVTEHNLFCRAMRKIISGSGSLDVICRPWAPSLMGLPGWMGKAERYAFTRHASEGHYERDNADCIVGLPGHPMYSASGGQNAHAQVIEDDSSPVGAVLKAKGFIIGKIEKASDRAYGGTMPGCWTTEGLGNWQKRSEDIPEEFWRTLVADRSAASQDLSSAPAWYGRACKYILNMNARQDFDTQYLERFCPKTFLEVLRRIREVIWNRRLFRLTRETPGTRPKDHLLSHLGLGPDAVGENHLIAVLYGCSVPVVLERRDDKYLFHGGCFVYGMMDGEALSLLRDDGCAETEFKLI